MERYHSFSAFYPFYINEHSNLTSRRLHVIGLGLALCCLLGGLVINWRISLAAPLFGYGLGFLGHYAFEHNRPASFRHPLYSLLSDFRMFFEVVSGRRAF
jgi:hypothetical protein